MNWKKIKLLLASLLLSGITHAQIITTVAGNGTATDGGDGGPATAAGVMTASGIAVDRYGNIFIGDTAKIRWVTTDGLIHTYAGTGVPGFSGDGGPASAAQFSQVDGIAIDTAGDLFIGDGLNDVVRKVDAGGTISTFAGTPGVTGHTGDEGIATAATLSGSNGPSVDNFGNVYVIDGLYYVRKIAPSGIITTVAGVGTSGFSGDGGPATAAQFCSLAVSSTGLNGNLYITDKQNQRIRKVDTFGIVNTIAGDNSLPVVTCGFRGGYSGDGGPATAAILNFPGDAVVDYLGNVYISDQVNFRVRKIDTTGIITTVAGTGVRGSTGDGGPASAAKMTPGYLAVDCAGNLYVFDGYSYTIRKIWFDHRPVFTEGGTQSFTICSDTPGVALDGMLAVMDTDAGQTETWSILRGAGHGTLSGSSFITTSTGGTLSPTGYTYVPTSGFVGTDTFSIQISDCADKNTATFYVTVSGCSLGTAYTAAHTTGLQVTPNPGNGSFTTLLSADVNEAANFVLTDVTGKTILSAQGQTNRPTLMQATAPPGIYILQATTAHGRYTAKIQVE